MVRLLAAIGVLVALLAAGCSTQGGLTISPSPSARHAATQVEGGFTAGADGRFEMTGSCSGVGSTRVPASPGATPAADAPASEWKVAELSVDLFVPAQIDGVDGDLRFKLRIGDQTTVVDKSGRDVPRSEQYRAFADWSKWTASGRIGEDGRLDVVEMRCLDRSDAPASPPVVTGLLAARADGLVDVPGRPGDEYMKNGGDWLEMVQPIVVDGVHADVVCSLEVDHRSTVVTTPSRPGSTRTLLNWVSEVVDRYDWQATARKQTAGTLALVTLKQL